ncbi:hypothetical protein DdX_02210 [Ditylenchus destructor]|uniref:WxxW domain-containing protein n=1 Tax=Ditylenchus destructor TaxID=166010 RepID=A0AAD4NDR8_9BILA|nr:hypothetical protein DdX_02210 [Ditylenchus destructor]
MWRKSILWPISIAIFLLDIVNSTPSVLLSSPFDNFRIECPHYSGAQRLSIRMIESQGMVRQDTVFALSCNHISELYPWWGMPREVQDAEREDCRYSGLFDPILETKLNATCRPREYLAGIARLSDTRIQMECCRMRSRDETGCVEQRFVKPKGTDGRLEIEYNAKLINAFAIEGDVFRVRFCDLAQRTISSIREDTTTVRPRTTANSQISPSTPNPNESTLLPQEDTQDLQSFSGPKRVIKIQRISSLSRNGNWETTSSTSTTTDAPTTQEITTTEVTTTTTEMTSESTQIQHENSDINPNPISPITAPELNEGDNKTSLPSVNESVTQEKPNDLIESPKVDPIKEAAIKQKSQLREIEGNVNESNVNSQTIRDSEQRAAPQQMDPNSVEVAASERTKETSFPTAKDYENVEEATADLMKSLAGMMEARQEAKNIISRVKAAGLAQTAQHESEEFAERMLKEIEGNGDPAKADDLLKHSMEVLAELDNMNQGVDAAGDDSKEGNSQINAEHKGGEATAWPNNVPTNHEIKAEDVETKHNSTEVKAIQAVPSSPPEQETSTAEFTPTILSVAITDAPFRNQEHSVRINPVGTTILQKKDDEVEDISIEKPASEVRFEQSPNPVTTTTEVEQIKFERSRADKNIADLSPITLPPIEQFPTPPPNSQARPPPQPRLLAELPIRPIPRRRLLKAKIHTTTPPSTSVSPKQSPKKDAGEEYDDEAESSMSTTTEPPTTRFPTTTRIPLYRRKLLERTSTIASPPTSYEWHPPRRTKKLRVSAALDHSNQPRSKSSGLTIDEETDESPFDSTRREAHEEVQKVEEHADSRRKSASEEELNTRKQLNEFVSDTSIDVFGGGVRTAAIGTGSSRFDKSPEIPRFDKQSPFDFPTEIRRAPRPHISEVLPQSVGKIARSRARTPTEQAIMDLVFFSPEDEHIAANREHFGKDIVKSISRDGTRNYIPADNMPVKMPDIIVYDTLDQKNLPPLVKKGGTPTKSRTGITNNLVEMQETTVSTTQTTTTTVPSTTATLTMSSSLKPVKMQPFTSIPQIAELDPKVAVETETEQPYEDEMWTRRTTMQPSPTAAPYDLAKFYYLPRPKRPAKEKVLTFCNKENAVRDQNNLIIACGGDNDIWTPSRCPPGTDCFVSADSTFRICCAVASG